LALSLARGVDETETRRSGESGGHATLPFENKVWPACRRPTWTATKTIAPDFLAAVLKGQDLQAFGQAKQSLALPV
jgi:hypothetical protein